MPIGNIAVGIVAAGAGVATALVLGGLVALTCTMAAVVWVIRRPELSFRSVPTVRASEDR